MGWLKTLLINSVTLFILSYLGIGLHVDGFGPAIIAALVFGVVNFVCAITLIIVPFALFGVFGLIIYEAILLWLVTLIVTGFTIVSFPYAILVAIILGIINYLFK
jgi:putative membrane protein